MKANFSILIPAQTNTERDVSLAHFFDVTKPSNSLLMVRPASWSEDAMDLRLAAVCETESLVPMPENEIQQADINIRTPNLDSNDTTMVLGMCAEFEEMKKKIAFINGEKIALKVKDLEKKIQQLYLEKEQVHKEKKILVYQNEQLLHEKEQFFREKTQLLKQKSELEKEILQIFQDKENLQIQLGQMTDALNRKIGPKEIIQGRSLDQISDEHIILMVDQLQEEKKRRSICVVCLERPRAMVCLPCAHLCLCQECSVGIKNQCPLCREGVKKIQKIFL